MSNVQEELRRITLRIPKKFGENLVVKKVDTEQEDMAREALRNDKVSPKQKEAIRQLIEKGAFRREEEVENEKAIKEVDEYFDRKVKQARRDGKLPDPMSDPYFRKRTQEAKNRRR